MHVMTRAEFLGTPVTVYHHAGRRWLTARAVGVCLGYAPAEAANSINRLYGRHLEEFGPEDTFTVKMTGNSRGNPNIRIFSHTGCTLLAMFANTARAKDFRAWAKRVLAGEPEAAAPAPAPAPTGPRVTARVSRAAERQAMELFVAGLSQASIARHLGLSTPTVCQMLNGRWRFSPKAGEDETTPELVAAVAAEHLRREQERVTAQYCASAVNQKLVDALEVVGRRILTAITTVEA